MDFSVIRKYMQLFNFKALRTDGDNFFKRVIIQ